MLRNHGVGKGSTVTVYLPMIPEAAYAMLACARLGAIHSVVFGGFSPDSLASRIEGCGSKIVITADEGVRGGRKVPLKANVDAALERTRGVDHVIVVRRTGGPVKMQSGRDVYYHDAAKRRDRRVPLRGDERGRPFVHPLHVGIDWPAERCRAHDWRLSRVGVDDAQVCLRLPRRRYLLVHR